MSIFDTVSSLVGGNSQLTGFVSGVQAFISQQGGLDGLKTKFEKEGAGPLIQSWISTGPNLPISQEQIQKVMGNQFVADMAKKMGVDPTTASQKLTEMLPKLVDTITPNGTLPEKFDAATLMTAASKLISKN